MFHVTFLSAMMSCTVIRHSARMAAETIQFYRCDEFLIGLVGRPKQLNELLQEALCSIVKPNREVRDMQAQRSEWRLSLTRDERSNAVAFAAAGRHSHFELVQGAELSGGYRYCRRSGRRCTLRSA